MKRPPESSPIVVIDSREPHADAGDPPDTCFVPRVHGPHKRDDPWADRARLPLDTVRKKLDVGDYSLERLEAYVAIERKSLQDLLSTLFGSPGVNALGEANHNLDRFRAELERARGYWFFAIVVEGSVNDLFRTARERHERFGKSFDPFAVRALERSFLVDLGIPTIWSGSKGLAELDVGHTLARIWSEATRGDSYRKCVARKYNPPWLGALSDEHETVETNAQLESELPALRAMS